MVMLVKSLSALLSTPLCLLPTLPLAAV